MGISVILCSSQILFCPKEANTPKITCEARETAGYPQCALPYGWLLTSLHLLANGPDMKGAIWGKGCRLIGPCSWRDVLHIGSSGPEALAVARIKNLPPCLRSQVTEETKAAFSIQSQLAANFLSLFQGAADNWQVIYIHGIAKPNAFSLLNYCWTYK